MIIIIIIQLIIVTIIMPITIVGIIMVRPRLSRLVPRLAASATGGLSPGASKPVVTGTAQTKVLLKPSCSQRMCLLERLSGA